MDVSVLLSVCCLQRKLLLSMLFPNCLLRTGKNLVKPHRFFVWCSANWHEKLESVGVCLLGGGKRNHDTHSIGCSGNPWILKNPNVFISTSANCCLPRHCVNGYCFQHKQSIRQSKGCAVSPGGAVVWMCPMQDLCPRAQQGPGRAAGKGHPCPLQEGAKGSTCPSCCPITAENLFSLWQSVFLKQCREIFLQHTVFLFGLV